MEKMIDVALVMGWSLAMKLLHTQVYHSCNKVGLNKEVVIHRLSLGMSGFEQQATGAVLDLTQDEEQDMKKMKSIKKWYEWYFGPVYYFHYHYKWLLGEYSIPYYHLT